MPSRISETLQDENANSEAPVAPLTETETGVEQLQSSDESVDPVQAEIDNSNVAASEVGDEASIVTPASEFSAESDQPVELESSLSPGEPVVSEDSIESVVLDATEGSLVSEALDVSEVSAITVVPDSSALSDVAEMSEQSDVPVVPEGSLELDVPDAPEGYAASDVPEVSEISALSDIPEVELSEVSAASETTVESELIAVTEAPFFALGEVPTESEEPLVPQDVSQSDISTAPETPAVHSVSEALLDLGAVGGSDLLDTVVLDYELTDDEEIQSAGADSKIVVSEEIDFNNFDLQVVDVDLFAPDDEASLAEKQVGEGVATEANADELDTADTADTVDAVESTAEEATTATDSVEKEQVENNENNIVVPASDVDSAEVAVVPNSDLITESDAKEQVVETVVARSEEPVPKGFVKRWAKRVVSWIKRFVGF